MTRPGLSRQQVARPRPYSTAESGMKVAKDELVANVVVVIASRVAFKNLVSVVAQVNEAMQHRKWMVTPRTARLAATAAQRILPRRGPTRSGPYQPNLERRSSSLRPAPALAVTVH